MGSGGWPKKSMDAMDPMDPKDEISPDEISVGSRRPLEDDDDDMTLKIQTGIKTNKVTKLFSIQHQ